MRILWILTYSAVFIWSAIEPKDYWIWLLEVSPAILGAIILGYTFNSFRLTPLVYNLILLSCIILMIGGHYTYAEVPIFDGIREFLGFQRNNYDKIGHFFQGFVAAMIARELIIRKRLVKEGAWSDFFIISLCLAISAFHEISEWIVAIFSEQAAEAFLGTQGYEWDAQSDMGLALIGTLSSLVFLSKLHDRQLAKFKLIEQQTR